MVDCCCKPNDPCDFHAASCTICVGRCKGHPKRKLQSLSALRDVAMNNIGAYLAKDLHATYKDQGNFSWCEFVLEDGTRVELQVRKM